MESSTQVLRRLLDERGEYYRTSGNKTWWGRPIDAQTGKPINVFHNQAQPMGEDRLLVELQLATPEQVIDATLGRETCRDVADTPHYGDKTRFECSECGYEYSAVGGFGCDYGDEPDFRFCPNCGRKVVSDG